MQKGAYILFLLTFIYTSSGFPQTTNLTPRELVLKHLEGVVPAQQLMTATNIAFVITHQSAIQNIQAMGSNAVPVLIEVIGYQPERMDEWYERAYAKAPASIRQRMSKPDAIARLREQATLALFNVPETKLYLNELLPLMQDSRPEVRRAVSAQFYPHAAKAPLSLRLELLPFLKDGDPEVRKMIMWAFSASDNRLPRAKAAFEGALLDSSDEVRMAASRILLQQEKEHPAALTTLKLLFNSTDDRTKLEAAQTYLFTQPESPELDREVGPVFNSILSGTNAHFRFMALLGLKDYGKPLKSTIPELQRLLTNASPALSREASNALRKIRFDGPLAPKKP